MSRALVFLFSLLIIRAAMAQAILVAPYIQPGDGVPRDDSDSKVIAWLTDQTSGDYFVEYGVNGKPPLASKPERVSLDFGPAKTPVKPPGKLDTNATPDEKQAPVAIPEKGVHYFKYICRLDDLPLDSIIDYRVMLVGKIVREGHFASRASAGKSVRFVMVGDLANGNSQQNSVAFEISKVNPQFLVALGDIVYPTGRVSQYMDHFWGTYDQPAITSAKTGAPLMASIPFYAVLGNHDVDTHNFAELPDALGAYYFFHVPQTGPGMGPWNTPLGKDPGASAFRSTVGASYPALGDYSFNQGPAHFLVLDNSGYANLESPKLLEWIERDLRATSARWKFVCYHVPMFHSSREHYTDQKMRLLSPLFERCGVDVTFSGHVHNYQRTKPLHFQPNPAKRLPNGHVNGDFQLDTTFDGVTHTRPDGIIHVVSGGGGGTLYKGELEKNAAFFQAEQPGNWVPFTAKFVTDRHSFTVVDLSPDRLLLRAVDLNGLEIDRMEITKPGNSPDPR